MRPFFFASLVMVTVSLAFAAPLDARGGKGGGKGGGGGGRGWSNGGGHGGGGPQWKQQSHPGSGQRLTEHGQMPTHGGKPQLADKPDKPQKPDKDKEHEKRERSSLANDPANPTTEAYNKKQKQLEIEQRNRDKRIAQAQHLREIGERNGNQNLIDNADRMEAFAHDHYARRVSQLEKFGVTDPLLNPGSVTDPLLPGTDGLVDPLGNVGLLDWLPIRP
jgi:hypothetical protein